MEKVNIFDFQMLLKLQDIYIMYKKMFQPKWRVHMPQQMLCARLNGSPMLSAYCSQYHYVTLAGHVADGRPTTKRVTG